MERKLLRSKFLRCNSALKFCFSFSSWCSEGTLSLVSNSGELLKKDTNSLELLMEMKLRLVHVSSNGIKNSEMNVKSFKVIQVADARQIFINPEIVARFCELLAEDRIMAQKMNTRSTPY